MNGSSDLQSLQPGGLFANDYQIERPLAQGGMGAVYVVRQLSTGRARALKLMHPMLAGNESMRKRFEQEARVGSHIKSSHVVEVIAAGVDAGSGMPWLAMELLEGEDLGQHVQRLGPRPLGEVAAILNQLCHALAAAHEVGVVHRDLKPENVFLARSLQQGAPTLVKLLDLGIAKIVAEASPQSTAAVGTPLWMAPEQMGGSVGPQADVWALGLLAFWMLTGRHYWRAASSLGEGSLLGVLRELASDPLEPASVRAGSLGVTAALPAGFDAWFSCAVARDPQARFANAAAAHQAFLHVCSGVAHTVVAPAGFSVGPSGEQNAAAPPITPATAPAATLPARSGIRTGWLTASVMLALACGAAYAVSTRHAPVVGPILLASTVAPPSASATPHTEPGPARQSADLDDGKLVWKVPVGDSPVRGAADAPVTIVELANYQCPFTKGVEPALAKLLQELDGKVRLVWKDDPLAVHAQAELAAGLAREARAEKGNEGYWAAHDAMLAADFKPSPAAARELGKKLGLDASRLEHALSEHVFADDIARDAELADDFMAIGTPYFFVNGRRVVTTSSVDKLRQVVLEELGKADAWAKQGVPKAAIYDKLLEQGRGPLPLELRAFRPGTVTGPTRGAQQTDAMIVEICDYKSLLCKLVDPMIDELLEKFPHSVGVTWSEPEHFVSDDSRRAAVAARSAYRLAGVDGFDRMRRALFEHQAQAFTAPILTAYAKSLGIESAAFKHDLEDPEIFGQMDIEASHARDAAIKDVPTFLICTTDYCASGGYLLRGGQPRRAFEKRVRLALAAHGNPLPASP